MHFPQTRWGAFGVHLLISVAIFVALLGVIVLAMFPGGLFTAAGGWQGIRIIAGVDLVLGPLLTLIVYDIAKPRRELLRDLSIIGAIQIAALAVGMAIVYQQRPIAVTWVHDQFVLSKRSDYEAAGTRPGDVEGFRRLSPVINYVELPDDAAKAQQIVATYALSGEKIQARADLVAPMPTRARQAQQVMRHNPLAARQAPGDCVAVPVSSRFGDFELCYRPATRRFERLPEVTGSL